MNKEDACFRCKKRHEGCQLDCREGKIASIKRELERRKKLRFKLQIERPYTDGEKKRAIKNLKWHGRIGLK